MNEEKYEFVEEVIKKRPSRWKRICSRLASWIGLAVVFSIGVVIVIFALGDNLREILFRDESNNYHNGEKVSLSVNEQEVIMTGINMAEIRDRIDKSIVKIKQSGMPVGVDGMLGTGVILSVEPDIYILTNYKKVSGYSNLLVEFCDGSVMEAVIWNGDSALDIATLKVARAEFSEENEENIRSASISNADWLENNFACIYEGNSFGVQVLSYEGKIAGQSRIEGLYDVQCRAIYTDIMMNNVNDGFLFDYNAGLMGIVINKISPNSNSSISVVAVYDIYPLIVEMLNRKNLGYLGICGVEVNEEMQQYIDAEMPEGVFVMDVDYESAAFIAGVMKGDVITEMDGQTVYSQEDIENIILDTNPGETVMVTLMRKMGDQYKSVELDIKVGIREEG